MFKGRVLAVACVAAIGLAACSSGSAKPNAAAHGPTSKPTTTTTATSATGDVTGGTPLRATLLRAVTSTESAKTAKLSTTISASGLGVPLNITMSGDIDFATNSGEFTVVTGGIGGASVEERIVGGVVYVRRPSSSWQSINLHSLGVGSSLSSSQNDPGQYLSYLGGVADDVTVVGKDDVHGDTTTKYHATIDMARALQRHDLPDALRRRLAAVAPGFASAKIPTDVWIDTQGRVRKLTMTIALADIMKGSPLASSIPAGATETVSLEYSGFGTPVHVVAPPANEVTPLQNPLGG